MKAKRQLVDIIIIVGLKNQYTLYTAFNLRQNYGVYNI